MKTKQLLLPVLLLIFMMMNTSCDKKDDEKSNHTEGYIVGFDQCTITLHYRIGLIIISKDLQDTLVTYNLSDPTYKMPVSVLLNSSDTLYKIPESHLNFPRYEYPIKFSYSIANEDEMVYHMCTHNILSIDDFTQVIIKSATK